MRRRANLRLLGEIGLAAIVGWVVFVLTSKDAPSNPETHAPGLASQRSLNRSYGHRFSEILDAHEGVIPQQTGSGVTNDDATVTTFAIRRAVMNATARDISSRGANPNDCLADVEVVGAQKIRFEIDVVATSMEIRTGDWRFVEIVDGQALPDSVLTCTARTFGGNYVISPREHEQFPVFEGKISTLYRIE